MQPKNNKTLTQNTEVWVPATQLQLVYAEKTQKEGIELPY